MRYVLVMAEGDLFTEEFETKEEAIREADYQWAHLTDYDKKQHTDFYVLESINPDEEAEDHMDGDIIKEYIYRGEIKGGN